MDLCIDIGNTSVKFYVFDKQNLLARYRDTFNWDKYPVQKVIIAQVGAPHPEIINRLQTKQIPFLYVSHKMILPFRIAYKTPSTLGADRIALVAGALRIAKGPLLVIDAGTCITYDFVNENNIYEGGAISPGLKMRLKAMHDYTAGLPGLEIPEKLPPVTGFDTETSMLSGAINGTLFEIKGFIENYKNLNPDLKVFLTGGDAGFLHSSLKNMIFAIRENLLAEGLHYLLQLNMPNE